MLVLDDVLWCIAHALCGMLPYYHSLAFSYGRANTIRMATCGRIYIYIYIYFLFFIFLFWKRRKKGSILKNIRIRVDGALAMWNSTHTCSISPLSSAILKMWVSQVVVGVCNAWIAAVSIETCACVVRTDGRTVTWQQLTIKISRMHR